MRFLLLAALLLIPACSPPPNGDYAAIREAFQAQDENFFLLGIATVGDKNDLPKRIISWDEYTQMQCLVNAGYLRFVKEDPDTEKGIETAMTPLGAQVAARFKETPTARRYEATRVGLDLFKIRVTTTSIDKVTRDSTIINGSGKYRIVELRATRTPTADAKPYAKACPENLSEKPTPLDLRILLRWNPASSAWTVRAADTGGSMFGYATDNVGDALKGL